jgi:prepilin-type N-terminal cleavage/methylation domain-containing protein
MMAQGTLIGFGRQRGISLLEMLVVVAVIGIMGFIASGHYQRVVEKSRETVAKNVLATLNQGASSYYQIEGSGLRKVHPDDSGFQDEVDVLRALQWVDPVHPTPGSPYVRNDYDPGTSANADDYRAVWNGAFFELRLPGQEGAGLAIAFNASDLGRKVQFADGYVPLAGH